MQKEDARNRSSVPETYQTTIDPGTLLRPARGEFSTTPSLPYLRKNSTKLFRIKVRVHACCCVFSAAAAAAASAACVGGKNHGADVRHPASGEQP